MNSLGKGRARGMTIWGYTNLGINKKIIINTEHGPFGGDEVNLNFIEDGYYTYIIHDNYELIISKVCPFEDGSKHIQLLSKTKNAYTAGEFHKNGTSFIVNMFAGLFRLHNPFIMRHNKNFVLWLIQVTFNKHGALSITITDRQLIYDNHFIKTGIWDVSILKQIGYKK